MDRYLSAPVRADLAKKLVFLVGPRQVGKTTLAKTLMADYPRAQYFNWDVAGDSRIILGQTWSPRAKLVVLDEIHKMRDWKTYLKGAWDGRGKGQALLVTGSARMDTFRQSGESLAGRYFTLRMHPVSVREWCVASGATPEDALDRLLERGGFPEPFLAQEGREADRWRRQYLEDLIREDVVEFSRIHEIRAMRLFVEMLRERVGSPVSLASIARDLQVSPTTLAKYLDILEALYVVFTVRPYHRNIARAILKEPKVYFFDTGLVAGDEGARFENACAAMLLKHAHYLQDVEGRAATLHYVRDKEGAEVDLVLCRNNAPVLLAECRHADTAISRFMAALAARFPKARAVQLVRELRQEEKRGGVSIVRAAGWLAELAA
ncbi:MAG: ATP-binding protein [Proteobacteria bacterium]|nr:ATP-binding protein [Pseudomonadota bacterium]